MEVSDWIQDPFNADVEYIQFNREEQYVYIL